MSDNTPAAQTTVADDKEDCEMAEDTDTTNGPIVDVPPDNESTAVKFDIHLPSDTVEPHWITPMHKLGTIPENKSFSTVSQVMSSASVASMLKCLTPEEWTLDTLPPEMFFHICSFLDAKFVIRTLSLVCQAFHGLVSDHTFWKIRIGKRWPKKYPAIAVNDSRFNWQEACLQREEKQQQWSNQGRNMDCFQLGAGILGNLDVIHLMQQGSKVAVGSRDRSITLYDLSKRDTTLPDPTLNCNVNFKLDAHKGWIWSFASCDNLLTSASWDTYVKFWDMGAAFQEVRNVKCKSAVLCTQLEADFLVAGGYDKKVYHIDPRAATVLEEKTYHRNAVLCVAMDDQYIVTCSEDKTIKIYDRRAGQVYKSVVLDSIPMAMCYSQDQLWVGDAKGTIHLIDASDGDFDLVEGYDVGHSRKVTGIKHTLGAIFTSSADKTIKVLEPTLQPDVIATLPKQTTEICRLDFQNDVLASCGASVQIWQPRDQ